MNTLEQRFSIFDTSGLIIYGVTANDHARDVGGLGHNTNAFDIGNSDHITITRASVYY